MSRPATYLDHLRSADDLVTTYEATRAGFVALALEKNRRATPYVAQARALQFAAATAQNPAALRSVEGIEAGLLTAAGLSNKSLAYLSPDDKERAISELIENFLEPAGEHFVEELVFRFLLTRGDALGGSMRNLGGVLAQRKVTRAILSTLTIAGVAYRWQHTKSRKWIEMTDDDSEIDTSVRGLTWQNDGETRTLFYNLGVPLVKSNIDLCLLDRPPERLDAAAFNIAEPYLALGELKGGIDPAGADEHWKTGRSALERIRQAFGAAGRQPATFFVGAAIEKRMATEIWSQLVGDSLSNAANLNDPVQVASLCRWLCQI
jgi:hypothetical protein